MTIKIDIFDCLFKLALLRHGVCTFTCIGERVGVRLCHKVMTTPRSEENLSLVYMNSMDSISSWNGPSLFSSVEIPILSILSVIDLSAFLPVG